MKKNGVGRLELVELLADEHPVGAEEDDLLPLQDLGDQLADAGVDHRLAAADRDDRGAALVDGVEAFLDRELLLDRRFVLADPAAAGAGQVAGVQRLEHQDHREPLGPRQLLLDDVAGDPGRHLQRESHDARPPVDRSETSRPRRLVAWPRRGRLDAGTACDADQTSNGRAETDVAGQGRGGPGRPRRRRLDRRLARRRPGSARSPSAGNRSGRGGTSGRRRGGSRCR